MIATLKPSSKFKKVQDAFAATSFDPTSDSEKIKMMDAEIKILKKQVQDHQKMIDQIVNRK